IRCFMERHNFFFGKQSTDDRARYASLPLGKLPLQELKDYGASALREADWGARLDTPDWQVLQRVQESGFDLVLPELRPLTVLGTALQVRFRGEIAERRFDDAVRTAKTMLALARHLGENPAEAATLVGLSIAHMA